MCTCTSYFVFLMQNIFAMLIFFLLLLTNFGWTAIPVNVYCFKTFKSFIIDQGELKFKLYFYLSLFMQNICAMLIFCFIVINTSGLPYLVMLTVSKRSYQS